ncbi:MAG: hypothetical protein V4616_01385 [Bacteroidota bacterium]
MRRVMIVICAIAAVAPAFSQQKVQIKLCEQMEEFQSDARFSVVSGKDTLAVPKLGESKFINPLNLKGGGGEFDKNDTSSVTLIIENYKYRMALLVDRKDLFCGYLSICQEKARYNKKLTMWSYINCQSLRNIGYCEMVKK